MSESYEERQPMSEDEVRRAKELVAKCFRRVGNWAVVKPYHLFDKEAAFMPEMVEKEMALSGPKIKVLLDKIDELDKQDMAKEGHLFKHMIFTDVDASMYSTKILASSLISKGFPLIFDHNFKMHLDKKDDDFKRFGLLMSKPLFDKSMNKKVINAQLELFNQRDANIHGANMRIMLLDQGFKEGIDLYDVKYVHLFETLVYHADEKQAIGRSTRFCGQKGLAFHPNYGWPLYVFRYETAIPPTLLAQYNLNDTTKTLFDAYLQYANIDLKKVVFAAELEEITKQGAVDKDLNLAMHNFSADAPPPIFGGASSKSESPSERSHSKSESPLERSQSKSESSNSKSKSDKSVKQEKQEGKKNKSNSSGDTNTTSIDSDFYYDSEDEEKRKEREWGLGVRVDSPEPEEDTLSPPNIMNLKDMTAYINKHFSQFAYKPEPMKNGCVQNVETLEERDKKDVQALSMTQDFVRHYFQPKGAYKGLLLYHGVGSGKTCAGIASASTSFEKQGYTILWVTRHTLKEDLWKNMVSDVCNQALDTTKIKPNRNPLKNKKLYMSKSWLPPISFKTFSNTLKKENKTYDILLKRNGAQDPLRKTLIIIDEAHKLYGKTTAHERPDVDILEKMIDNSYRVSGKKSCKVLLMTATPYTSDGFEMIKLLNLLRMPGDKLATTMETFAPQHLDADGVFTAKGKEAYLDSISGYISYLNRSLDARNFARPTFQNVLVPLSMGGPPAKNGNIYKKNIADAKEAIKVVKERRKDAKTELKMAVSNCKKQYKKNNDDKREQCIGSAERQYEPFEKDVEEHQAKIDEAVKALEQFNIDRLTLRNKIFDLHEKMTTYAVVMNRKIKNAPKLEGNRLKRELKAKVARWKQEITKLKVHLLIMNEDAGKAHRRELSQESAMKKCIESSKYAQSDEFRAHQDEEYNDKAKEQQQQQQQSRPNPNPIKRDPKVDRLINYYIQLLEERIKVKPVDRSFILLNFHPDKLPVEFSSNDTDFVQFINRIFDEMKYNIEGKPQLKRDVPNKNITLDRFGKIAQKERDQMKMGGEIDIIAFLRSFK